MRFHFQNLPGTVLAVPVEGRVERRVPRTGPAAGAFPGQPLLLRAASAGTLPPARLTSVGFAAPTAVRTV